MLFAEVPGKRHRSAFNWDDCDMTSEQFKATLHQQPIRPFTIRMDDGRSFAVPHPDFVAQSHSGRTVIVFQPDETYSVLDLLLMSELQVSASNGHAA